MTQVICDKQKVSIKYLCNSNKAATQVRMVYLFYSTSTFFPTGSHLIALVIINPTNGTILKINMVLVRPTAARMIGKINVPIILPVRLTASTNPVACDRKYVGNDNAPMVFPCVPGPPECPNKNKAIRNVFKIIGNK